MRRSRRPDRFDDLLDPIVRRVPSSSPQRDVHPIRLIRSKESITIDDVVDERVQLSSGPDDGRARAAVDVLQSDAPPKRRRRREPSSSASDQLLNLLLRRTTSRCRRSWNDVIGAIPIKRCTKANPVDRIDVDKIISIGEWVQAMDPIVDHLLSIGADVEITDQDGHFPLEVAIRYSNSMSLIQRLLNSSANPERIFKQKFSLIDIALTLHQPEYVRLLLERGAVPFVVHEPCLPQEDSLICFASLHDFRELAQQSLISATMEHISDQAHARSSYIANRISVLIQHGLDVKSVIDGQGRTALHLANSFDLLRLFLQSGCDPNILDTEKLHPMQRVLLQHGSYPLVRLLLDHGADPACVVSNIAPSNALISLLEFSKQHAVDQESIEALQANAGCSTSDVGD